MLCAATAGYVRAAEAIPALDDLAGDWMEAASLGNLPALNNFHGGLKIGSDLASVTSLNFPPFSQGSGSGVLRIGGRVHEAAWCRWYPYQLLRRTMLDGVQIECATRMVFEAEGVLFRLKLTNTTAEPKTLDLQLELDGRFRRFDETWSYPYPHASDGAFAAAMAQQGQVLLVRDAKSPARSAYAFARPPDRLQANGEKGEADWSITLPPRAERTVDCVLAIAGDDRRAVELAAGWAATFEATFQQAKDRWEARWREAFTPGNRHFSGHLPTLVTSDRKLRRVYYLSLLSVLMLERTNYPISNRVFVTCGPEWAVTLEYFWDTGLQPHVWALLEPVAMREHLKGWLAMDLHSCYARDYLSGHAVGPWYGANDLMVFRCLDAYLNVTGERAFLREQVAGKTVLQHIEAIALHGKRLARPGSPLGDYGGADNLLECVPTYIHRVPSLNAANVWMLRRAARLLEASGQKVRAEELRSEAARLLPAVLDLYVPGDGVWYSLHRDGSKVPLRHIYDFATVGRSIPEDLTPSMKKQMVAFVERELLTKNWLRAQSLADIAAAKSDRPDHGPMGSYDAWAAETIDVMWSFGYTDKALGLLHRIEELTYEGPFAQSHELLGRGHDARARIAHRGSEDCNAIATAAFADVILRALFGFRPELDEDLALFAPDVPRGFAGKLLHLRRGGKLYTISSGANGVRLNPE